MKSLIDLAVKSFKTGWSKIDGNVFQSKSEKIQQTNECNKRGGDRGYQLGAI